MGILIFWESILSWVVVIKQ